MSYRFVLDDGRDEELDVLDVVDVLGADDVMKVEVDLAGAATAGAGLAGAVATGAGFAGVVATAAGFGVGFAGVTARPAPAWLAPLLSFCQRIESSAAIP